MYVLPNKTAETIADVVMTLWVCDCNYPLRPKGEFNNQIMEALRHGFGAMKTRTTGIIQHEQYNRTILSMFSMYVGRHLPYVTTVYDTTVHVLRDIP